MLRGSLAPEILPPHELANILGDINKNSKRTLWPTGVAYLPLYYKFCRVVPIRSESFMFLVAIPLLPSSLMKLDL